MPFLLAAGLLASAGSIQAQFVWTGSSLVNGSVTDPNNWQSGAPVGNGTESLQFGDLVGIQSNVLVPTSAFADLTFNGTARPAYVFSGSGATPVLTFNGNLTATAGNNVTFDNTLALSLSAGTHTLTVASPVTIEVDGAISGAGGLSLVGSGGLTLTGANTYSGGTILNGGYLTVTGSISHAAADLQIGQNSGNSGTMTIESGGQVSDHIGAVAIGASDATGTVFVDGPGSAWVNASYLYVGELGSGTVSISNGALVSSPNTSIGNNTGGNGSVAVDGAGSRLVNSGNLYVGSAGTGTLTLTNGGQATNVVGSIGNNAGGTGIASVDGPGSVWTNSGDLYVGTSADGYLAVTGGGVVNSANGYLGGLPAASGSAVVDGAGSTWNVTNGLTIGSQGTGELALTDGGTVNVGNGSNPIILGNTAGSTGELLIGVEGDIGGIINAAAIETGSGSGLISFQTGTTAAAPYYLTRDGTATGVPVVIAGPTVVDVASGYNVIAGDDMYTGGTNLVGGTLVAASNTALGAGTVTFLSPQATLNVASGVTVSNALNLINGGTLAGNGTFASAVTVGTGVTLAPGNTTGTLSFANGLTLAGAGTLNLAVQAANGAAGVGYDLVVVSGGTLNLTANSITPFKISIVSLNGSGAAGSVGDFSSASGYVWTIFSAPGGVTGFSPTDFTIDTTNFANSLGTGAFYVTAAGNEIDLNFSPVPEPSTWVLLSAGLGLAGLLRRRRRGRHA